MSFIKTFQTSVISYSLTNLGNLFDRFVAERTSYLWRVNYFDRWSRHIFSPNEDDESHSARRTFPGKSNSVKARRTFFSSAIFKQDGRLSDRSPPSSEMAAPRGEPSDLRTLESALPDQRFPVEYKLDEFIPLRHSAISFLLTLWVIIIPLSLPLLREFKLLAAHQMPAHHF